MKNNGSTTLRMKRGKEAMKKRWLTVWILLIGMAATVGALSWLPIQASAAGGGGTAYYFSTLHGDNNNSGTSQEQAWASLNMLEEKNITLQAGDKVYLERGSIFNNEFLHLRQVKGTPDAPIVIDAYGDTGAGLPVINTNGQGIWYQNYGTALDNAQHVYRGYVSSSILLYDCEYIEINNIAMTNRNLDIDVSYNSRSMMNRTGVAVVAQNGGTLDHIYLKGLDIQDVEGNVQDKHMNNGGIYFTVFKPQSESSTGIARYNDVLIEDCYLKSVNRWGIAMAYTAYHAKFPDSTISNEAAQTYGMTNVVIRNNYLEDVGGDAITTMYCYRPIVEYNVANGAASQINARDYKGEGTSGDKPFGCVAASVWPWKCKDAVFQYNEVYNTHNDGGWNGDGQAWDADWGDGTVYQYNYSHDNEGGCFMICLQHAYNSVFRYNISQNDSTGIIVAATSPNANIYNNTFYIKENVPFVYTNSGRYGALDVKNNIIYYAGRTPKEENWRTGTCGYANNIFVNYNNVPAGTNNIRMSAAEGASLMVDPGKGRTGNAQGNALNTLDGYKLRDGSRAINAGTMVQTPAFLFEMTSQGVRADQDFFGNPIGLKPDIGAFESDLANEGSELLLVSSVYQIVEQDSGNSVNGIPKNTTVEQFLTKVQYTSTATVQVTRQGAPVGNAQIIQSGDILILSRAGTQKQYTLYLEPEYYERTGWTATAGSAQNGEGAEKVLDGKLDTLWHSDWDGCRQEDAWISIDMKKIQTVSALQYVPRQSQVNGLILEYKIEFSKDGSDWSTISSVTGTWAKDNTTKMVTFSPVQARYVRLTGVRTASDGELTFISAAEIYLGRIIGQ